MNALPDLKEYYINNSIQPLDNLKVSEEKYVALELFESLFSIKKFFYFI